MDDQTTPSTATLKVTRSRRRLYQTPSPEPVDGTITGTAASVVQRSGPLRRAAAQRLIHYHSAFAGTAGAMPIPLIDSIAVAALQLKLVRDLCRLHGIAFSEQRAKASVAAILGGLQTGLLATSLFKYIPLFGYVLVSIPVAAVAGGVTYAVGRVFDYHFEQGGSLKDFDSERLRGYFQSQLRHTKRSVKHIDTMK